jgi:hypothetical protein
MRALFLSVALMGVFLGWSTTGSAQAVAVTMSLDNNSITAGGSTVLHVYAQVTPALRSSVDRIFSWYIDVLNTNGAAAAANYAAMVKPASDNDQQISSTGITQGANRRGIYDTFLNLPGAGTAARVELARIPIVGVNAGTTRFVVQAGTGVPALSSDFLVVPLSGSEPLTGGDYTAASATLQVSGGTGCNPTLSIVRAGGANLTLSFTPCAGRTHFVEARTGLGDVTGWQPLLGAPHNSGSATVNTTGTQRFFRVRTTLP